MDARNGYRIYFPELRELWRNPQLSPAAKVVLLDLLLYAGTDNKSFPSQETLAKDLGYKSSRHIRNILNELKKFGVTWDRGGFGKSNKYSFSKEIYYLTEDADRKFISYHSGNKIPKESGTTLPAKVVSESNQLKSSHIQQLFVKTFKTKLNKANLRRLHKLCEDNPTQWIEDAIKEIATRGYDSVSVGLIAAKIADYVREGKAKPKPSFQPCGENGCENGYILGKKGAKKCQCRENYDLPQGKNL